MDSKEENDMHNSRNEHGDGMTKMKNQKHCNMNNNIKDERNEHIEHRIRHILNHYLHL